MLQPKSILPEGLSLLTTDGVLAIVGGGVLDPALLRELAGAGAMIVAADGGADLCDVAGIVPDAIIGDLDSLSDPAAWAQRTRVIRIPEQMTTDFEKCLYMTRAKVTVALGMTGKRFDHTLAALDAVARYGADRRIILADTDDVALAVSGSFRFDVGAGERVSVHPLQAVRFARSEGLKYPLDGIELAPGGRTGTSNEAVADEVAVVPAADSGGVWLLIVAGRHLNHMVEYILEMD